MTAFEITTLPSTGAFHTWADHLNVCDPCLETHELLKAGTEVPVTNFCLEGAKEFLAFMQAVEDQHSISLLN